MGLSLPLISALAGICETYRASGSLLALGVQTIRTNGPDVARVIGPLRGRPPEDLPSEVRDRDVYRALGFGESTSIDLFPGESPDRIVDLGAPLPDDMKGRFNAFLDSGTLEHVFDVRTACTGLINALRVGGVAIHISPFGGFENHGFYQFGPKFFARLYAANGFHQMQSWVIGLTEDDNRGSVVPVADFEASLRPDPAWFRSLVLFAARRAEVRPFAAPIDTHLAELSVPRSLALAPDARMVSGLAAAGFGPTGGNARLQA